MLHAKTLHFDKSPSFSYSWGLEQVAFCFLICCPNMGPGTLYNTNGPHESGLWNLQRLRACGPAQIWDPEVKVREVLSGRGLEEKTQTPFIPYRIPTGVPMSGFWNSQGLRSCRPAHTCLGPAQISLSLSLSLNQGQRWRHAKPSRPPLSLAPLCSPVATHTHTHTHTGARRTNVGLPNQHHLQMHHLSLSSSPPNHYCTNYHY